MENANHTANERTRTRIFGRLDRWQALSTHLRKKQVHLPRPQHKVKKKMHVKCSDSSSASYLIDKSWCRGALRNFLGQKVLYTRAWDSPSTRMSKSTTPGCCPPTS